MLSKTFWNILSLNSIVNLPNDIHSQDKGGPNLFSNSASFSSLSWITWFNDETFPSFCLMFCSNRCIEPRDSSSSRTLKQTEVITSMHDCPGRCCQLHLRYNTDNTHCFMTLRPALRPLFLQLSKKRGVPSYAIFLSSPNDVSERNRSFPILMNFWSHNLVSIILTCVTSYISLLYP